MRFDPRVPKSFNHSCEFPKWREAMNRGDSDLNKHQTWSSIKFNPGMKPVPYTWSFRMKPLDAIERKHIKKAQCCLRGDKQIAFI